MLVKLAPTPEQHAALLRTLEAFNAACNAMAAVALQERLANKIELQKLVYYDSRERFGFSAQMAIRAIAKVAEAYKRDKHLSTLIRVAVRTGRWSMTSASATSPRRTGCHS